MKKDIGKAKTNMIQAQKDMKNAINKAIELESHSMVLQKILSREKEEGISIHKQTSAMNEQIRIVQKYNADKALQVAIAAGKAASDGSKSVGKSMKKAQKTKLKKANEDDSSTTTTTTTTTKAALQSIPSTPRIPINNEFDEIQANYLKEIKVATNAFVEGAPRSGSPRATPRPDLGSPSGDHSEYDKLQNTFQKDVNDAENKFIEMMEKFEFGEAQPKKDLEGEAKQLRKELEALKKSQLDVKRSLLENLSIELDNKKLMSNQYIIDSKDLKTNVKITSPGLSPEELARKKAKEEKEARKKKEEEEEARKKKEEEEARKKKEDEELAKKAADEVARRTAEEARKKKEEEEARKKKEDEELAKKAADEAARRTAEEATRRAAEDEARRKRDAEDEARRKRDVEDAARRTAEDEARRKRDVEDAARRIAEDEARRKRDVEDAARRAAEDEARRERDVKDAARRVRENEARKKKGEGVGQEGGKEKEEEFFNEEMQGTIKENIKEVLGHLEVISKTVQQKATTSGTAESSAKDILKKLDESD